MMSLARFASAGQCAAAHAARGVVSRRTAAIVPRWPAAHRASSRSARVSASRWRPGDGTDDELPKPVTEILIDAMDTASKLRNRDAGGKVTTVLGDLGQSTLGGNLTWQELDERVNEYPSDRKFQAIGEGGEAFVAKIVGLVEEALGRKVDPANVTSRPSSKGKYVSANVTARLENGDEVVAVFSKLKECEDVKWYL